MLMQLSFYFEKILKNDSQGAVRQMLHGKSREQYLPPNLPSEQIASIPYTPGVYYFHDQKGKVIYVGKAKNPAKPGLQSFFE